MTMTSVNSASQYTTQRDSAVESVDDSVDILVRKGCVDRTVESFSNSIKPTKVQGYSLRNSLK